MKRKEEASRRSRGARERGRSEKKRKKRERRKKKKERMRGAAPHPGSLAGCTRARNYISRLVCGLGRRQQDVGSEWRGERRPGGGWRERLKMEKWKKSGSRENVGDKKGKKKVGMMGLEVEVGDV